MKILKEHMDGIVFCLFELVVGILLLFNPIGFTSGIIMIAGIVLMVLGLVQIIKYFKTSVQEAMLQQTLVKGLILILLGIFCAFKTEWFIATFPVLTTIYGVVILVTGISKVQLTVDMLRQKKQKWFWAAINAACSIVFAAIILFSPFTSTAILWMFTGISLLVEGALDIITLVADSKGDNC